MPDGHGGLLASWARYDNCTNQTTYKITHFAGNSTTTYSLPTHNILYDRMVLGDNDTVFAADNTRSVTNEPVLFAFDLNTGAAKWTYQQAVDQLTLIAASDGGGVVAKSTLNGVDTILRFIRPATSHQIRGRRRISIILVVGFGRGSHRAVHRVFMPNQSI